MEAGDAQANIQKIMKDPGMLAALQNRLMDMEGMRSPFFDNLPKNMKKRVYALRNIQKEYMGLEAEFYGEINKLEQEFHKKYERLYQKRQEIISAKYEPTEQECAFSDDDFEDEEEESKTKEEEEETNLDETKKNEMDDSESKIKDQIFPDDVKGVPEFWSSVLKSAQMTSALVEEDDDPVLKYLSDITLEYLDSFKLEDKEIGFQLNFHFDENDFFTNSVLTKTYKLQLSPEEEDTLNYEGPEITDCTGCTIEWKTPEMNVTNKIIKKKQKNKKTGAVRVTTVTEARESFFNFFSSIEDKLAMVAEDDPEAMEEDDAEEQAECMRDADYEIGHFIRERLIPRAVLYYTGELNDEDDDEDDDGDYLNGEGEGSDIENDPDFDPSKVQQQPECKQQ